MPLTYKKNAEGQFICPHCDYTARLQSTMHYHLKKHAGDLPHKCKHCNQKFLQKSLLDFHIKARHSDKLKDAEQEVFECPCDTCDYKDIRKGNRLIHFVRIHLKDLTEAIKTKTEEKGFVCKCKTCDKSFKSMTQFYYHAASCIRPTESHRLWDEWYEVTA